MENLKLASIVGLIVGVAVTLVVLAFGNVSFGLTMGFIAFLVAGVITGVVPLVTQLEHGQKRTNLFKFKKRSKGYYYYDWEN